MKKKESTEVGGNKQTSSPKKRKENQFRLLLSKEQGSIKKRKESKEDINQQILENGNGYDLNQENNAWFNKEESFEMLDTPDSEENKTPSTQKNITAQMIDVPSSSIENNTAEPNPPAIQSSLPNFLSLVHEERNRFYSFYPNDACWVLKFIKGPSIDMIDILFSFSSIKLTMMIYGQVFSTVINHPFPCVVLPLPTVRDMGPIIDFCLTIVAYDSRRTTNSDEYCYHYNPSLHWAEHVVHFHQCACFAQQMYYLETCYCCKNRFEVVEECACCNKKFCEDCYDSENEVCMGCEHDDDDDDDDI
eukprot:TRINITY_DN5393_c0_g1_i9.p1 TRINITY_DN5393_c0_g1~~TRINITY_DN5393_c0_g1_i9.p1  ORF type:complete len:304 (-),score=77.62 TRINITY_DN5393_c0_g1_i9:84-995(-)